MLKTANFSVFGPGRCGLYHTAKDLILSERAMGIDAQICCVEGDKDVRQTDGQITVQPWQWALDADVWVRHSALHPELEGMDRPIIMALHGRPESSYRLGINEGNLIFDCVASRVADQRYRAFIYFWPEFRHHWEAIIPPDKLFYVPAMIDGSAYANGKRLDLPGDPKILIADIWRDDLTPINSIVAAAAYIEQYAPKGRIHIVGLPVKKERAVIMPLLNGLVRKGVIGSMAGQVGNIADYYATCDVVVTPHTIATRIIRESMSAGLPVVAGAGCQYTRYHADHYDTTAVAGQIDLALRDHRDRAYYSNKAEAFFGKKAAGEAMQHAIEHCLSRPSTKTKLFLDIGAHLGETIHRWYRTRPDAEQYKVFAFEPDGSSFSQLWHRTRHMPNVACVQAGVSGHNGSLTLYPGQVNSGEGSTALPGKMTGQVDYTKGHDVRSIILAEFLKMHPADHVVVKMNIEGGEYELMDHIVKAGLLDEIDELYINTHSCKFPLEQRMAMDRTETDFRQAAKGHRAKLFIKEKGEFDYAQCVQHQ